MTVVDRAELAALAASAREVGLAAGLDRVGIADAAPFDVARAAIEDRKARGLDAGMQFTYRNPPRSTDPSATLPGVRALVVAALAYAHPGNDQPDRPDPPGAPTARVARYAVGDHYAALRQGLEAVAAHLRAHGWAARVLVDDNALVDRAAAHRAGLGWYGKNANLLVEGAGSWFVLGSVLTDAPLPTEAVPVDDGCHTCTRCLDGCPTGAIVAPGVIDGARCLAWLVQAEGTFPREHRVALDDRLYGCDTCQDVCPPTTRPPSARRRASLPAPEPSPGAPPRPIDVPVDLGPRVAVLDVLGASDEELLARFGRWYIPRRDPRHLRRNALIVLGNRASRPLSPEVEEVLVRHLADPDPLLRGHAVWAARRLGRADLLATPALATEADPAVLAELAADVEERAGS